MFFILSKIIGYLLQPSIIIVLATVLGTTLLWTRFQRTARVLLVAVSVCVILIAFTPLNFLLMASLEYRIQKPTLPPEVKGIVVLGGASDNLISTEKNHTELHAAGDRLTEALILARRFPEAKILFSGGANALISTSKSEAEIAGWFFENTGIASDRMIFEDKARNTYENAIFAKKLASPTKGEIWLLITSAFHMPRSLGIFRKAGWHEIKPWPVDYRTRGMKDKSRISASTRKHFNNTDIAVREYVGLLAYWLTGRTDTLFPK